MEKMRGSKRLTNLTQEELAILRKFYGPIVDEIWEEGMKSMMLREAFNRAAKAHQRRAEVIASLLPKT